MLAIARAAGQVNAPNHPGPAVRPVAGLALGERREAVQVECVVQQQRVPSVHRGRAGRSLAAVQPPAGHPELNQMAMLLPPPFAGLGVRKVDEPLILEVPLGVMDRFA